MKDKNNGLGRKFFARVKTKKEDNIIPYDGDDAVYAEGDIAENAEIYIDMEEDDKEQSKDYIKSFVDVIKNKVSKSNPAPEEVDEEAEADELDNQAEAAFDYFRGITKKIENLKKSVSDVVKTAENGRISNSGESINKYMEDVNERLEEINLLLDERMEQINLSTGAIKNEFSAFDEQTKGKYEEISQGIQNVTKTTEENVGKIKQLSETVDGVKERVNEIHTTTNSFDKLYDSVFEFKNAISSMKDNVETLTKKQSKMFVTFLIMLIAMLVMSAAGVVLGILALVM